MADPFPCPKSGDLLSVSGEMTAEGETMPVYQCDRCDMRGELFGEPIEAALTLARTAEGRLLNGADPDEVLRF